MCQLTTGTIYEQRADTPCHCRRLGRARQPDPYCILDEKYHGDYYRGEHFARNPGGEWVHIQDVPDETGKAVWGEDRWLNLKALLAKRPIEKSALRTA